MRPMHSVLRQRCRRASASVRFFFALILGLLVLIGSLASPIVAHAEATQIMWRLYNPNTGEHFYTANTYERNQLGNAGWNFEGGGWLAPLSSRTPVYRLYNPVVKGGDHHYTVNSHERDALVRAGWRYEGIGWYSDDARGVALQRLYNPRAVTGTHHYTVDTNERDALVRAGWRSEGVAWYACGLFTQRTGTVSYRLGCTRSVVDVLSAHEHDSYYLGTANGDTAPGVIWTPVNTWNSRYPNGRPNPSTGQAYLNCAGFISAVIADAGGTVSPVARYVGPTGYNVGNDTNAYRWRNWILYSGISYRRFSSKAEMLSSGYLSKGDLIFIEPAAGVAGADCHLGFFWGSTSSEDRFWHSLDKADGLIAGSCPGNMISRITSPITV